MFYCRPCGKERGWPIHTRCGSYGRCEICGKESLCEDVPSSSLPITRPSRKRRNNMKKFILVVAIFVVASVLIGKGFENWTTRRLGDNMEVDLPLDQKLFNVTWKDSDLWILTRDVLPGEQQHKYLFYEKSSLGLAEGSVTLQEHINLEMRQHEQAEIRIVDTLTLPTK